jgi:hypothetical protein
LMSGCRTAWSGHDLCAKLSQQGQQMPIIMLTGSDAEMCRATSIPAPTNYIAEPLRRLHGRLGILPRAAEASRRTAQLAMNLWSPGANSNASRPSSVSVCGSGQVSPAAANRVRHSCAVLRATLTATAIARSERPHANFNRRISRTSRIDTLSAGIGPPLALTRGQTAHLPSGRATPPPQGWPTSDRNGDMNLEILASRGIVIRSPQHHRQWQK